MTARRLGKCPTCFRPLDDDTRTEMGLRNGEALNALAPGMCGPSDIDHVLHNGRHEPDERVMFFEYKNGAPLGVGQKWLLDSLAGDWRESNTGRLLTVRYAVLPQSLPSAENALRPFVEWLWPETARIVEQATS